MTQRIQRSTPATLEFAFYADGELIDTDDETASVTITKADGTTLVDDDPASRSSEGVYLYELDSQDDLNLLTATCSGLFDTKTAKDTVEVEIIGGFLFTIEQLRNYDVTLKDKTKYPDSRIVEVRDDIHDEFQDNTGRSFVPRFEREILSGDGTDELWLAKAEPLRLLSLTVDGVDELATAKVRPDVDSSHVLLRRDAPWSNLDWDNIIIEYEYGLSSPDARVVEAAKKRARSKLVSSRARIDERATMMQVPEFGTFMLATPGKGGAITGIPDVDKVLHDNDIRSVVR